MTIGPKNDPRPLILHVDSETGIPYRLAESDSITVGNINLTTINNASYTPGVGPGGIDPTAINVTSLQGTGTFFLTALTGTFVLTATTGVFATTSYVGDQLAGYCGPGLGSPAQGDMAYYNGGWQKLPRGTVDQVLTIDGSPLLPTWKTSTGSVSIPVTINQGGSNYTGPYETNGLLYFNGTRFTSNTQLTFDGTTLDAPNLILDNPLPVAEGGTGLTTIPTNNQVLYSNGSNLVGNSNLTFNGTTLTANTLNLTNSLTVAHGGTGRTSLNAGELLIGDGTNAVTYVSQNKFETTSYSRSNYLLTSVSVTGLNGTGVFTTTAFATANYFNKNSDTLPITRGGTGRTSFTDKYIPFYNNSTTSFGENGNLYFDSATTSLVSKTLVLADALGTAYGGTGVTSLNLVNLNDLGSTALAVTKGGTGRTSFVTGAIYANSTTSIERHEGLTDLAGFADNNPFDPFGSPPTYYPNYAALPFIGTTGRYVRLQTGQTPGGPSQYGKVLRLYDPGFPVFGTPGYIAEPRWEFLPLSGLQDVTSTVNNAGNNAPLIYDFANSVWKPQYTNGGDGFNFNSNLNFSATNPSSVSATYQYGSPIVWQYGFNAGLDAQVTATNGWWGGLELSSWIGDALLPELDNYYITNKTGYYPSANLSIVSLSATTVSATTYLNLTGTWDLSTLNSYYVNVSGDSANAGFHFSSVSANGMVLSATAAAAIPLQVRFASGSTASHAVFASADGTEIARLNLRGTNNLFFGKSAGNSWSTGSNNVAIGHQASQFLSTGSDTVAIGSNANYNSTTSQRNTSIGSNAGGYPGTSTDNVNIGYFAGYTQTGSFNISVGPSVNYATVGARNVGVGYQALHRNTSGTGNIGLGYRAGYGFSSTATNNIAIGHDSNITEPTTFSNTIVIGSGIASTASNQTIIGHPQTSSTLIRGALSATSYVNAPLTSGTFSTGDVLYYNGSVWVKLAKPANPAVLLIDDLNGTGLPYWEEAPNTSPSTSYVLQVDTDGSNNPGAIYWGTK